ncbi:MAG: hypothetical protein DSZ05_05930 [Sulfurospirillum sp.]|nr:MAG: hypothetical protein DSZ05_05930 [Sulfurospirillum sp.]
MTTFVTALHAEAAPIIEKYRLTRQENPFFPLYSSEKITLIVSGMTPLQSAIATTYLLTTLKSVPDTIANLGICASTRQNDPIGTCYAIRKITDTMTQKVYHLPKIESSLPQTSIATYPVPQQTKAHKHHLLDMESSGFYTAARRFLPPEKIRLFKVVSDYGNMEVPDTQFVREIIQKNLSSLEKELSI